MTARASRRISTNTSSKNLDRQRSAANIDIPPASASPFAGLPWKRTKERSGFRANLEKEARSNSVYRFMIKRASISARLQARHDTVTRLAVASAKAAGSHSRFAIGTNQNKMSIFETTASLKSLDRR